MLKSFATALDYNGHAGALRSLLDYVIEIYDEGEGMIRYPNVRAQRHGWDEPDHPVHVFWSTLVVLAGDYGVSPRYGWLETDKLDAHISELRGIDL